ncbi:MAG: peptidyl-prolyl cis-trans isomerase [Thermoanaerobaculia bacterium]
MRRAIARLSLLLLAVGLACTHPRDDQATDGLAAAPEGDLAVWDGGEITAAELDASVLALVPAERESLSRQGLEAWEGHLRHLAAEEILLAQARTAGLEDAPGFRRHSAELRRRAFVDACVADKVPVEPPQPDDLRRLYDRDPERWAQPERRMVYHIFRRAGGDAEAESAVHEMEEIRRQVRDGRPFGDFTESSDSEARHRGGLLGWIERGRLSPDFDRVVFGLEEGVPSEPVRTRDGVHLFYVDAVLPSSRPGPEQLTSPLTRLWRIEELNRRVAALEERLGLPEGSFVATPEELDALVRSGNAEAVVLRLGANSLTLGQLHERALEEQRRHSLAELPPATAVLEAARRELMLDTWCRGEGFELPAAARQGVDGELADELRQAWASRLITRRLRSQPETLERFFQRNVRRFGTPLRLRLRRLAVPLTGAPSDVMARLERQISQARAGESTLETIAAELGGTLGEAEWTTLSELDTRDPKAREYAAELSAGDFSDPFRVGDRLVVLELLERRDPQTRPLDEVRDAVEAAYRLEHAAELDRALEQDLLAEAGYHRIPGRLEAFLGENGGAEG